MLWHLNKALQYDTAYMQLVGNNYYHYWIGQAIYWNKKTKSFRFGWGFFGMEMGEKTWVL